MEDCQDCGTKLVGRVDKRFCSDSCRINHNNMLSRKRNIALKKVNSILKKNAVILHQLNGCGITALPSSQLEAVGFDFNFFTHQIIIDDGKKYNCCYNYGYHVINKNEIKLISIPDQAAE